MSVVTSTLPSHRIGLRESTRHALLIARRNLLHVRTDAEQLTGVTIQPLMFMVLFVFVFGGAISGSSRHYLQFALPGIMVQGTAFATFTTSLGLNTDFQRGLIDRFRSLPIARSAVVTGRILADSLRFIWGVFVMTVFAMALGFRFSGGFGGAIGSLVLVVAFGIALCWPMALLGISAKTPESVNTFGFLLILPLTFASSVFVPTKSLPGWLQAWVKVNPITNITDATRAMMHGGAVTEPLLKSIAWLVGITLVFAPLAVRRYRRRI
jgi:ABC transporter DrrB family efflux protein